MTVQVTPFPLAIWAFARYLFGMQLQVPAQEENTMFTLHLVRHSEKQFDANDLKPNLMSSETHLLVLTPFRKG